MSVQSLETQAAVSVWINNAVDTRFSDPVPDPETDLPAPFAALWRQRMVEDDPYFGVRAGDLFTCLVTGYTTPDECARESVAYWEEHEDRRSESLTILDLRHVDVATLESYVLTLVY